MFPWVFPALLAVVDNRILREGEVGKVPEELLLTLKLLISFETYHLQ